MVTRGLACATASIVLAGLVGGATAACASTASEPGANASEPDAVVTADRCLVRVHGRTERGSDPAIVGDGVAELAPDGNAEFGDGFVWLYSDSTEYDAAVAIVAEAIERAACEHVVLNGFSNGASFVAKLVCDSVTFDDTLVGAVIDDPVPDTAVEGCEPASGVQIALYWTGALVDGTDEQSCDDLGWTCDGDTLLSIDNYAAALGVDVTDSPHDDHIWYRDAPELMAWLGDA